MTVPADRRNIVMLSIAVSFFVLALISTIVIAFLLLTGYSNSKACIYKGTNYKQAEAFMDDCNSCSCDNGKVVCTTMACEDDYGGLGLFEE